jgi:hypothetical protein
MVNIQGRRKGSNPHSGQTGRWLIQYTAKRESGRHRTRSLAARFHLIKAFSFSNKINRSQSRLHQILLTRRKAEKITTANIFVTQHADANVFRKPNNI